MFRKPKRKATNNLRQRPDEVTDQPDDTNALLQEAKERVSKKSKNASTSTTTTTNSSNVMHSFSASNTTASSNLQKDLATSTNNQHTYDNNTTATPNDGIFRNTTRNKFHAGPLRAAANVRVTARFDYQPDVCKDYKETGFCGFGDTCIYLHDRGDYAMGWQIDQEWDKKQKELDEYIKNNVDKNEKEIIDDGLPFACHICRSAFTEPVVTTCGHYFCQGCIMDHVRSKSDQCPICNKDTHGVFNEPTKLISKMKKVLGLSKSKETDAWQQFAGKAIKEE